MSTILSPNRHVGRRAAIRLVVIHTMEVDETGSVAESVGARFADPARQASAQVGVDTDSECRYVSDQDTAWAAPGSNADGLHLELAGRAGQTTGQWTDAGSKAILERAAQRVAAWCRVYAIPVHLLTDTELADGHTRGIVGHDAVSRVFKRSNHWDPGPNFPWHAFLARVRVLAYGLPGTPPASPPIKPPVTRIALKVDGLFGPRTRARLQQWAGADVDSRLGPLSWMAIQTKVRMPRTGRPNPRTWMAIQAMVGAKADGQPGLKTVLALQAYLNTH